MQPIVNRVTQSSLITLDLTNFKPTNEVIGFDLKDYLFRELLLREKDFRLAMKEHDWLQYGGKHLAVFCSSDAIVPMWAYMLIAQYAAPIAESVDAGSVDEVTDKLWIQNIEHMATNELKDKPVILKGCGDKSISPEAYLKATAVLQPIVRSLMYGEACSSVPVYKRKR